MPNTKPKYMIRLSSKVALFIPIEGSVPTDEYCAKALGTFKEALGSGVIIPSQLVWERNNQDVTEKAMVVMAYCTEAQLKNGIDTIVELCEKLTKVMTLDHIVLEVNGEFYHI